MGDREPGTIYYCNMFTSLVVWLNGNIRKVVGDVISCSGICEPCPIKLLRGSYGN